MDRILKYLSIIFTYTTTWKQLLHLNTSLSFNINSSSECFFSLPSPLSYSYSMHSQCFSMLFKLFCSFLVYLCCAPSIKSSLEFRSAFAKTTVGRQLHVVLLLARSSRNNGYCLAASSKEAASAM